ncbi:hypothetical protein PV797_11505 [Clostridiaceae bacterium M8S5]|nr:hypothetical protein PV797_11505 [Clostridiaceae bacterium M8S5]
MKKLTKKVNLETLFSHKSNCNCICETPELSVSFDRAIGIYVR